MYPASLEALLSLGPKLDEELRRVQIKHEEQWRVYHAKVMSTHASRMRQWAWQLKHNGFSSPRTTYYLAPT